MNGYGEVNRSFIVRWKDELDSTWHLLNFRGSTHSITYNQDLVTLTHFGQSVFLFTIFKSSFEPKAYPKWYFLYHQVPNSVTFKVLLTEYKVTCNSLVRFIHLNLERTTECRIIYNHWRKTAKIGNGWRNFA
ncbi:hypothetical protein HKD37_09G025618 [Glycine soja]